MTTVAFIGLGNMGSGMADNLVKNDYNVLAFDLSEAALAKAKDAGCTIAQSTEQAAAEADIVITMLPAGKHVKDIYSNQILDNVRDGTLLIDCSTIDVETAKSVSELAEKKGLKMLDAPVSGGQAGAENGALTVMIGGDQEDFDKAKDKIDCYSKKMKLLGKAGNGQLAKMVNQICIGGLVQALSEGINFGIKAGLNMEDVIEVISKGAAQSWQMDNRYKTMIDDKFEFGFAVDWMRKDLKIALEEAKKNNSLLPITEIVDKYYGDVQKLGGNRWDTSSLIRRLRK